MHTYKEQISKIEELANECQDTIDALQYVLGQARKSSESLRAACEYIQELHELRVFEERNKHPVVGDPIPCASVREPN